MGINGGTVDQQPKLITCVFSELSYSEILARRTGRLLHVTCSDYLRYGSLRFPTSGTKALGSTSAHTKRKPAHPQLTLGFYTSNRVGRLATTTTTPPLRTLPFSTPGKSHPYPPWLLPRVCNASARRRRVSFDERDCFGTCWVWNKFTDWRILNYSYCRRPLQGTDGLFPLESNIWRWNMGERERIWN